jgi:hypothetical protein
MKLAKAGNEELIALYASQWLEALKNLTRTTNEGSSADIIVAACKFVTVNQKLEEAKK